MCDDISTVEKARWADAFCTIDNLIWEDEVARFDFFPQRAHGGESNYNTNTQRFQGGDVGAYWDERGCDAMCFSVSR